MRQPYGSVGTDKTWHWAKRRLALPCALRGPGVSKHHHDCATNHAVSRRSPLATGCASQQIVPVGGCGVGAWCLSLYSQPSNKSCISLSQKHTENVPSLPSPRRPNPPDVGRCGWKLKLVAFVVCWHVAFRNSVAKLHPVICRTWTLRSVQVYKIVDMT